MNSKNIVPHLLSLQSGSDKILKLMRRRYNTNYYRKLINKIKSYNQSTCIGVDVIVGFPSEHRILFLILDDTVEFIKSFLFLLTCFCPTQKKRKYYSKNMSVLCKSNARKKEVKF